MVQESEAIKEFGDIYEREFDIKLSHDEAKFKAEKVLKIFSKVIFYEGDTSNE